MPAYKNRNGFTLIEMLVSVALVLFVMVLLSQAFTSALEVFRQLKGLGDMEERLRVASTILRRDVAADHFEGHRRLSEANFFRNGPPNEGFLRIYQSTPASAVGPNNFYEGVDGDGIPSYRSTDHILHMAVRLRGNRRGDFFSTNINAKTDPTCPLLNQLQFTSSLLDGRDLTDARYQSAGTFTSEWADCSYCMRPNGNYAGSIPLSTLYRHVQLIVPTTDGLTTVPATSLANDTYAEISCKQNPNSNLATQIFFNCPADVTIPQRRYGLDPSTGLPMAAGSTAYPIFGESLAGYPNFPNHVNLQGADILLNDVISFDVRIMTPESQTGTRNIVNAMGQVIGTQGGFDPFVDLWDSQAMLQQKANPQLQTLSVLQSTNTLYNLPAGQGPRCFDTWSKIQDDVYNYSTWYSSQQSTTLPLAIQVLAIQITIRVWDQHSQQTRQVTIIQDM